MNHNNSRSQIRSVDRIVEMFRRICLMAGSRTILDDIRLEAESTGVLSAIQNGDNQAIYDWLFTEFNFQGVSNHSAEVYLRNHGHVRWQDLDRNTESFQCEHLQHVSSLQGCKYDKISFTCANPELIDTCPLPSHRLRNGRLNKTAYSLYLFIRDEAHGNIVNWIDQQLALGSSSPATRLGALIGPMRAIYGVSDKVLTMSLSVLLMGAGKRRPHWFAAGKDMIAVDTLIHNLFCRSGLLHEFGEVHAYGDGCYQPGGCCELIWSTAKRIDAKNYNAAFPSFFPRFVQHAIWRYCAQSELNICNGNRIRDTQSCKISFCGLIDLCQQLPLRQPPHN